MLRQLFLNLISNALKFAHPDRRLRITIDTDAEGAVVIADNGLGIPKEAQAKIFHSSSKSIGKKRVAV